MLSYYSKFPVHVKPTFNIFVGRSIEKGNNGFDDPPFFLIKLIPLDSLRLM